MTEPTYELMVTDFTEEQIGDKIISIPFYEYVRMKYPKYTATAWRGKKRDSFTFHGDDIEKTIKILRDEGEIKDVARALITNAIWAEPLVKHCNKIITKEDKKKIKVKTGENKRKTGENKGKTGENKGKTGENKGKTGENKGKTGENKRKNEKEKEKEKTKQSKPEGCNVDLNVDTNVKLSQWI